MTAFITALAPDDGDEQVLDHVPCRCGGLAEVVLTEFAGETSVAVRCDCGAFAVPEFGERS